MFLVDTEDHMLVRRACEFKDSKCKGTKKQANNHKLVLEKWSHQKPPKHRESIIIKGAGVKKKFEGMFPETIAVTLKY